MSSQVSTGRFMVYMPFLSYGISIVVIFVPFLIFVFNGWGVDPNGCLLNEAGVVDPALRDNCFCERVDIDKVMNDEPEFDSLLIHGQICMLSSPHSWSHWAFIETASRTEALIKTLSPPITYSLIYAFSLYYF